MSLHSLVCTHLFQDLIQFNADHHTICIILLLSCYHVHHSNEFLFSLPSNGELETQAKNVVFTEYKRKKDEPDGFLFQINTHKH